MTYPWWQKTEVNRVEARAEQRTFIVWDGEGVVHDGRTDMSYVLFGHSGGQYISGPQLSTDQCLLFLMQQADLYHNRIHVAFGFSFDVDQILRDIDNETLTELKANGAEGIKWKGYHIKYLPRKFLEVSKRGRKTIKIYDTISFFSTTMIGACKQYIPDDPSILEVEKGKAGRSSFHYSELESIILPYWKLEGELMVSLMVALRFALTGAGIAMNAWHGPGAIAQSLLKRERIATHIVHSREEMPEQVVQATKYSYFGGRFENFIIGRIEGPIYSYDIRSAYPAALAEMPGLIGGEWFHVSDPHKINPWGIYRSEITDANRADRMGPLPFRGHGGTVSFGQSGMGWHYGHEIIGTQLTGCTIDVWEGWEYVGSGDLPFLFLKEMYYQRRDWKKAGNPAQLAAKLGLNSIYGKLAQLTGFDPDTLTPPKYHHQWYAGQTTSWCRARIYLAMMQNPSAIIACETDGIYSREPLQLTIGEHLGQWEEERYDEMVYVQSGVYFGRQGDTWKKARVRGLSSVSVNVSTALDHLEGFRPFSSTVHRYGAMSGYIGRPEHHTWFDQERTISWGGNGKRTHIPEVCPGCANDSEAHRTVMTRPECGQSQPRVLPWEPGDESDEQWSPDDVFVID